MLTLFAELTREEARERAADSLAVVPTASIEQHGPHLAVVTDTLLVTTVARRSAEATDASVVVTPTVCYGNSHHHRPHPGRAVAAVRRVPGHHPRRDRGAEPVRLPADPVC